MQYLTITTNNICLSYYTNIGMLLFAGGIALACSFTSRPLLPDIILKQF
jgi:hypothetical protein